MHFTVNLLEKRQKKPFDSANGLWIQHFANSVQLQQWLLQDLSF